MNDLEWVNDRLKRIMGMLSHVEEDVFMSAYEGNYTAEECADLAKIQEALVDCMSRIYDVQQETSL